MPLQNVTETYQVDTAPRPPKNNPVFDLAPPDAFRSRFQDGPLDLRAGNGEFAAARRGPLEARLAELAAMEGEDIYAQVYW